MEDRHRYILAVDDDPNILRMLKSVLTHEGYQVNICDNGEDGLRLAEETSPDLIILDVSMPGMNGLEVMNELRLKGETSKIPILFLSAVDDEATVVKCLKGGDDYMLKPLKSLELEVRLDKIFDRARKSEGPKKVVLDDRLPVKLQEETYLFPLDEIYYIEAYGRYCYVHIKDNRYLTDYSISELAVRFEANPKFIRVHRSYILNADHINKVTRDERGRIEIVMATEPKNSIRVSGSYLEEVKERLGI